jgi:nitrate/nitrite-specific signal transduction histidine kinase
MAKDNDNFVDSGNVENKELFVKGKEFLEMYNKVAHFTEEVLSQNQDLSSSVQKLEEERAKMVASCTGEEEQKLQGRIDDLKKEKEELLGKYREVSKETKDFLDRYHEIETENNNLANLYVASYQLHSTLDFNEVLEVITEIIINLIGAGQFAVLLHQEKHNALKAIKAEGINPEDIPMVKLGEGLIGSVTESGDTYYRESAEEQDEIDLAHPLVCLPMKIQDRLVGAIVVYKLLPQKQKLGKVDYELFGLLAAHAATALFSARLYSESVRKRETIKGFLDLITH